MHTRCSYALLPLVLFALHGPIACVQTPGASGVGGHSWLDEPPSDVEPAPEGLAPELITQQATPASPPLAAAPPPPPVASPPPPPHEQIPMVSVLPSQNPNPPSTPNAGSSPPPTSSSPERLPPSAPSGLTAKAESSVSVSLTWIDNADNETLFVVERRSGTGPFEAVASLTENTTNHFDIRLSPATTYTYRLLAANLAGRSAYSDKAAATTQPPPAQPPAAPSNLTAAAENQESVRLRWDDRSTDEEGFTIERREGSKNFEPVLELGANAVSTADSGLASGKTYFYRVCAKNTAGPSAFSNVATARGGVLHHFRGSAKGEAFGRTVSSGGDMNGDGRGELLVGAPLADSGGFGGQVTVYSGQDGSVLYNMRGKSGGDRFGEALAGGGDINGDGRADFIVGAPAARVGSAGGAGKAYVFSGKTGELLYERAGAVAEDASGCSVDFSGDVNEDGRTDFVIGICGADPDGLVDAGRVDVYSGADGTLLISKPGEAAGDRFGSSVHSAGDVNTDGRSDIVVGAPRADSGLVANAGYVYVFSGATGSLLYQKAGSAPEDHLGISVSGGGDVNGDGKPDFMAGSDAAPSGLYEAGTVFVFSGATGAELYRKNGAAAGDRFGSSVDLAGDVNADGRADFVVGAQGTDSGARLNVGAAYVYSGSSGILLFREEGDAAYDSFGASVSGADDTNGDGRADFIVGAESADNEDRKDVGGAFVFFGGDGGILVQKDGPLPYSNMGTSVSGGIDVDGVAGADFLVGAAQADAGGMLDRGSAFLFAGGNGALLQRRDGESAYGRLGQSVALAGDADGDGRGDLIVGEYGADPGGLSDAGSAYVFSGKTGALLHRFDGSSPSAYFGYAVGAAGDVDGDGRSDFIVGTYGADPGGLMDAGSVFVYSGATGSQLYAKSGANGSDAFGYSVSSAGDVNGDGRSDFIVGANRADPGGLMDAGAAYVFSGKGGSLLHKKTGTAYSDYFGSAVGATGDVNGDGLSDFIVGAYAADPGGLTDAGSAFVFSGSDGRLLFQKDGNAAGQAFGSSVAGVGDLNGDGRPDFVVGSPKTDPDGIMDAGSVFAYSGADGTLLCRKDGGAAGDFLGTAVSVGGDILGNGRQIFLAGAPGADSNGLPDAGSAYAFTCP